VALTGNPHRFPLKIPMIGTNSLDFSFAGLKSGVLNIVNGLDLNQENNRADMAATFQHIATSHLERNLKRAFRLFQDHSRFANVKNFVVSGGVARNQYIRQRLESLAKEHGYKTFYPLTKYCTDNGVMIAWTGVERYKLGFTDDFSVDVTPRLPFPRFEFDTTTIKK